MRPRTLLLAGAVLALATSAQAHLIRIPTGLPDDIPAPLDLGGGVLTGVNGDGKAATSFRNFLGDFVFGVRGSYPDGVAAITLAFDRPVTHINLWAGLVEKGSFYVETWSGPNIVTSTAADTLFPGGGSLPAIVDITPSEPVTKLVILGASWLEKPTFWRADVVFTVPEPNTIVLFAALGPIALIAWRRRHGQKVPGLRYRDRSDSA